MTATLEEADDYRLLSLANEKRKFAISIYMVLDQGLQDALERGIDAEWFRLIDVSFLANAPGWGLTRVFRLTDVGTDRLDALRGRVGRA